MNNYFNDYSNGTNTLYWWLGQVVDEKNWVGNINPKLHDRDDVPGWGWRYKVRIFGRDSKVKKTPDDKLEMAEVLLPVTAGSGHAGSVQSANIRQGSYVVGFYKDGIDAREPIIFGVLPNNSQTDLFGGDPNEGFIQRSGYFGKTGQKRVSTKNIYNAGPNSLCTDESEGSCTADVSHSDQYKDGTKCHYVPKTRKCDGAGGELKGIQKIIKQVLATINRIKAEVNSFLGAASDLTASISQLVDDVANAISGLVKTLLDRMRAYVVNKLNNGVKDLVDKLPPNQRPGANEANEKAVDILQCVFNKIIRGLVSLITNLLNDIIENFVNAPLCAIESFIGNLLGNILGDITNAIQSAISAISGIIGKIGDFAGQVLSVLDIVAGVLKFLSCEEEVDCTMGDEWSFWDGAKCAIENASQRIRTGSDRINGLISGGAEAPPCNTAQIPCGPPTVSIFGGGGSGAIGNAIVSATGSILGIDFISGGTGYSSPPSIEITDGCGIGNGAVVIPIINDNNGIDSGQVTIDDNDDVTTIDGETRINGGTVSISPGTNAINARGGTVTSNGKGITVRTTGGTTTSNGGRITVNGGTSSTDDQGNRTVNGGTVTITGGTTKTTGGNNRISVPNGTPGGIGLPGGTGGLPGGTGGLPGGTGGLPGGTGVGRTTPTSGSIINVVVIDPGVGYLPFPNGSTGGNGSVFSKITDTILFPKDGGYTVVTPGKTINVKDGDTIYTPPGTNTDVYDTNGNIGQTINGQGGTTPIGITTNGTLTAPIYPQNNTLSSGGVGGTPVVAGGLPINAGGNGGTPVTSGGLPLTSGGLPVVSGGTGGIPVTVGATGGNPVIVGQNVATVGGSGSPVTSGGIPVTSQGIPVTTGLPLPVTTTPSDPSANGTYPVVLTIGDVAILNSGVNYSPEDQIVISPDNGAELKPVFNEVGALTDVIIVNPGIGFTEFPSMFIQSQQGINAVIVPVFNVLRVGDLPQDQDIIPPGTQIINVVDCVGKVH